MYAFFNSLGNATSGMGGGGWDSWPVKPALSMHLGKTFPLSQLSTERLGQGWQVFYYQYCCCYSFSMVLKIFNLFLIEG